MDTTGTEAQLMSDAGELSKDNRHVLGPWESFLGGAVRIAVCQSCNRFAMTEILPNGDDEAGNQQYKTEIRGSAPSKECGKRVN